MKRRILAVFVVIIGLALLLTLAATESSAQRDAPLASFDSTWPAPPSGPSTLSASDLLWRLWGSAESVAVQGNYAYLVQGTRLLVINLTTQQVEGELSFNYPARDVAVSGDYAYVVTDIYGDMHVVDIQDPANPHIEGTGEVLGWQGGEGIAVRWPYAYVICGSPSDGLVVFDVTTPTVPSFERQTTGLSGRWARLGTDHLYVLKFNRLYVFDIDTDPTDPDEKGGVDVSSAENLTVAEPYVYVTGGAVWPGVYVVNVTDPNDPEVVEEWNMIETGSTLGVAAHGNHLYVGYNPNFWGPPYPSIRILDVSEPLTVTQESYHNAVSGLYSFVVSDTTLYVAGGHDGDLLSFDLTSPTAPTLGWHLNQPGYTEKVRVVGDRAYVVARSDHRGVRKGLWAYDLSDPLAPVEADKEDWLGNIQDLAIAEPYVYMSGGQGLCFRIRRTDDLGTPVGSSSHRYTCYGMDVKPPAAYLVVPSVGVDVMNVTDPEHPSLAGTVSIPEIPTFLWSDIVVDGDRAYVVKPNDKFYVLDISTPLNPTMVVSHTVSGLQTLHPKGNYVYAGTTSGLAVLDVQDLQNISQVSTYPTLNAVSGVDVEGYVAYLSGHYFAHALDVTYPQTPTLMWSRSGPAEGADIQGMGPHALVADEDLGLTLYAIADGLVSPDRGDPSSVLPWEALVIKFARPMNIGSVIYTCTPDPGGWSGTWGASATASTQQAENRILTLTHNQFTEGQDYTFTVTGGQTAEGAPIDPFDLTFSVVEVHQMYVPLNMKGW